MFFQSLGKHPVPWIASYSPEFAVPASKIEILKEPAAFFQYLKDLSASAKKRVTLASLYIGTGHLEQQLVSCLHEGLANKTNDLKVQILLDYTRGSRGRENSRTLLLPLLKLFPSQVHVSLYHTPKLRGFLKWILPERWNETIGLTHLKVYLFDDTLMLSGANLSDQYFTNRQDRYVLFKDCKELADFFDNLVATVSSFSLQLHSNNTVALHPDWDVHPMYGNYEEFIRKANESLQKFVKPAVTDPCDTSFKAKDADTLVYPLIQMRPLRITQEEKVVQNFLKTAEHDSQIKLASGYFNLTRHYMDVILRSSKASYDLLVASPKVNGFYGASGVAGAIPAVYTYIAKQFFDRIVAFKQENRIRLHEYERDAWTFHVKGLWYYRQDDVYPTVSLIGSPNFGYRSVYKDLEAQVAIVTTNEDLQKELHEEQERLYKRTTLVGSETFKRPDRNVPLWVKIVTFIIRDYF